mgnify:CR=1 FL=1
MQIYACYSILISGRRLFLLVLTVSSLISMNMQAQNRTLISGIVKGINDELLMGNVLLMSKSDSSLIKGAFYIDGEIKIEHPIASETLLRITSMGFMDTTLLIEDPGDKYELGTIHLKENSLALEGATVTATHALIERSVDGTTVANVQNTMLSTSTTISELFSKLPNLISGENGILVLGKGEPIYYLDGRRVSQSQIISLQVNQIRKVEIISNPSAKYDAQGKAVLNIISVRNGQEGLQGNLMQNTTFFFFLLSYSEMDLRWRKEKWTLAANYGLKHGRNWGTNLMTRETTIAGATSYFTNDYETNSLSRYSAKYNFGARYQINKKSNISIEYLGAQKITDQDSEATTLFTDAEGIESTIDALTGGVLSNLSNALNVNYNNALDTLGSSLFIGAQYSGFVSDDESIIDESIDNDGVPTSAARLNESSSSIRFITGQADLEKNYRKGLRIDLGAKLTYANNTGKVDFFSKSAGQPDYIHFPGLSNDFEYSEYIPAAYLQLFKNFGDKLKLELGVRGEYTNAKGNSRSLPQTVIDTTYLNFFPNASIRFPAGKLVRIGVSYSSSINRPAYQALDPFLYYIDSLTSSQGNPELQPEYAHSLEGSISLKQYTLTLGYSCSREAFRYAMIEGNYGPNSTILTQFNIQKEHSYYTSLTLPFKYKKFRSVNILGLTLDKIQDERVEFQTDDLIPRAYIYSRNSLLVDKIGMFELNGQYLGTRYDGIYYRKPAFTMSAGVSRGFFEDRLSCSFTVNDFLRTFEVDGYYQLASSKVSYIRRFNTYFYRLSLRYTFGKLKEINYSTRNVGEDADSRIQK